MFYLYYFVMFYYYLCYKPTKVCYCFSFAQLYFIQYFNFNPYFNSFLKVFIYLSLWSFCSSNKIKYLFLNALTFFFLYFSFLLSSGIGAFRVSAHFHLSTWGLKLYFAVLSQRCEAITVYERKVQTRLLADSAVVTAFFQARMTEGCFLRCPHLGAIT